LKEEDCISRKIKYLIDSEGMKQAQAVAYATNYCKKNHNHSAAPGSKKIKQLMGGAYKFRTNDDGSFTILDVPIMSEVPKGEKGNKSRVSLKWMKKAVAKAKERAKLDGYMAPLHIDHHDNGKPTAPAGFIMPTRVERMKYEGNNLWTVFADLEVQGEILAKIRKKELPYRSVEIFGWDKEPEINSLALLSDEVPFFRYPVLTLGEETKDEVHTFQTSPLSAYREAESGVAILFNFKTTRVKMAEIEEKKEEEEEKVSLDDEPREEADVDEYRKGEEEGEKKEENLCAKMMDESTFDKLYDLLSKIADKLGIEGGDEEVEVEETVEIEEAEEDALPPAEDLKLRGKNSLTVAKLSAQVAALQSRATRQDNAKKLEKIVDDGMKALSGWSPDQGIRNKMSDIAKDSRVPAKSVRAFVETYKNTVPKLPPTTFEDYNSQVAVSDHPEVMKFQAEGPETFEKAREASEMYDQLSERGVIESSRAAFIATTLSDNNNGENRR
tara:strand:+ start:910 stop:2403 length:1494 start_codon:yes stop_codon:yes gene_type:complete